MGFEVSSLLVEHPSGVGVYGGGLIGAFAARPGPAPWLVHRWSRLHRRRFLPPRGLPVRAYLDARFLHRRVGLLHALDTRFPERFGGPLVATLFDVTSALPLAAELRLSSDRFLRRKQEDYRRIARRADAIITLSRATRDRFLEIASPRGRVLVVPPGIDPVFLEAGAAPPDPHRLRRLGLEAPYVLAVGALHPRKNPLAVLEAYRRARARHPPLQLALPGRAGSDWKGSAAARQAASDPAGIRVPGYLPREDLAALYAGARALLILSHHEGFGLPVLEAMACGVPVVAARRGGIPEAAGEAALLVDPDRPGEAAEALSAAIEDEGLRGRLREAGRRRAAAFTWEEAVRGVEAAHAEARRAAAERLRIPGLRGTP